MRGSARQQGAQKISSSEAHPGQLFDRLLWIVSALLLLIIMSETTQSTSHAQPRPGQRGKQASEVEFMLVARSWIAVSEDEIVGKSQDFGQFTEKHIMKYWELAAQYRAEKKADWENVQPPKERTYNWPVERWNNLRKVVTSFQSVRLRHPKKSGENDLAAYYDRIRPMVKAALKDKGATCRNPKAFEPIVDYLVSKPKFKQLGEDNTKEQRPKGKRAAQMDKQAEAIRKKVEAKFGVSSTDTLVGGDSGGGAAVLAGLLEKMQDRSNAALVYAAQMQAWQQAANMYNQQQHTMGLLASTNPAALEKYMSTNQVVPPPGPPPMPPPPPASLTAPAPTAAMASKAASVEESATESLKNSGPTNNILEFDDENDELATASDEDE